MNKEILKAPENHVDKDFVLVPVLHAHYGKKSIKSFQVDEFLHADKRNIVAVHCKAGKVGELVLSQVSSFVGSISNLWYDKMLHIDVLFSVLVFTNRFFSGSYGCNDLRVPCLY